MTWSECLKSEDTGCARRIASRRYALCAAMGRNKSKEREVGGFWSNLVPGASIVLAVTHASGINYSADKAIISLSLFRCHLFSWGHSCTSEKQCRLQGNTPLSVLYPGNYQFNLLSEHPANTKKKSQTTDAALKSIHSISLTLWRYIHATHSCVDSLWGLHFLPYLWWQIQTTLTSTQHHMEDGSKVYLWGTRLGRVSSLPSGRESWQPWRASWTTQHNQDSSRRINRLWGGSFLPWGILRLQDYQTDDGPHSKWPQ